MKKTKLPVFKDGVSVYDWDITLSNFAGDVNWLLKTPTSTVSQLCIEQLIPVAQQAMHKKFILSILNRSDKHSGIDWTDLAYMLSRPIAIMHPLTQEKMHVKIAMQYNQIDSSTMEKAEGRKCICMSVTFTQVTIEEYNQKRQATFFVQDELSQRRRQIRFQPLLEEDKIRPSTPPH